MPDTPTHLAEALRGRYSIERELGQGGMARVYLARDLKHDRLVALKVLHPELARILGTERFLREIRLCARLQHPHILAVHDSGDAGGLFWFTMPFIEGETLRERLRRERQLPLDDALRIAGAIADALHYAHLHGAIHRDVKPENILLPAPPAGEGASSAVFHAMLADFGIARAVSPELDERLTSTGMTVGTPEYMSPEQASGDRGLDARTDIYSMGCVLYEMLVGEPPFTGPTAQAVLAKRLTEPVPHVRTTREVPLEVERAVAKALARAPADRFASADEFAAALQPGRLRLDSGATVASARRSRVVRSIPLGLGLLAVALGGYVALRWSRGQGPPPLATAAVLPFADLSPGKDQEYFSDGLTDELITALSQVPGLRVAARTSSFQFKGQNPDVRAVGARLNVGAVLEGSVRRSGNRLRVSAQLISVKDGYELWSESYDRNRADVFAVQEDVARSIVAALRVRLAPAGDSALSLRPTADLQAYDLYLKGRFAWNQRTGAALRDAVRYLEQAVGRDPTFARAWAALADAYILVVPYGGGSPAETWRKAQLAAARALALDRNSAEAYTSLAYGNFIYAWNWRAAEENFHRAIAANPGYATGHQWYADFLAGRGRLAESLDEMSLARQLDPLSRQIGVEWGWVSYLMRRYDEAAEHISETLELDPNYPQAVYRLALVRIQQHRYAEAIASLRRAIDLGVFYPQAASALAVAYAASGDRVSALGLVRELERRSERELVPPIMIAIGYGGLGDTRRGIAWLNRGIEQRDTYIPENFFEPILDPLRGDPGFREVSRRLGL